MFIGISPSLYAHETPYIETISFGSSYKNENWSTDAEIAGDYVALRKNQSKGHYFVIATDSEGRKAKGRFIKE